jgi:hypothetical protein
MKSKLWMFALILVISCTNKGSQKVVISPSPINVASPLSSVYYGNYYHILEYLNNDFIQTFPNDLLETENNSIPDIMNKAELDFYQKYAGIYRSKKEFAEFVNDSYSSIHRILNGKSSWGNELSFFSTDYVDIDFSIEDHCFYLWYQFQRIKINDNNNLINNLDNYIKISGPNGNDPYFKNIINEKIKESKLYYTNGYVDKEKIIKMREFMTSFFYKFYNKLYDEVIEMVSSKYGLSVDGIKSNDVYFNDKVEDTQIMRNFFKNRLQFDFNQLNQTYSRDGYLIYLNVFYSESANDILLKYPNSYYIEFRKLNSEEYASFIIIEENPELYKICYIFTWVNSG